MSTRDLIIAMDSENLKTFIENKTQMRDDLWRDSFQLEQEASRMKRAGSDVNLEIAIARVELRKRGSAQ